MSINFGKIYEEDSGRYTGYVHGDIPKKIM